MPEVCTVEPQAKKRYIEALELEEAIEKKVGQILEETMVVKGVTVTNQQGDAGCCTVF